MEKLYRYRLPVLIVVSILLYSHTLFHDFVFDDNIVLVENQHITKGFNSLDEIWTTNYLNGYQQFNDALYRPLSLTVFNLIHSLAGMNPLVFHLVNIVFYAFLILVVYLLFSKLYPTEEQYVFWAVLLFAAHPVHTEVVANIKSLDEILALLLGLGACYFTLQYIHKTNAFIGIILFYLLALFSKESAISFLLIIPLFYYLGTDKVERKKIILLGSVLLAITLAWYSWHQNVINSMSREVDKGLFSAASNSIIGIEDPVQRFITGLWLLTKYFLKLIIPWPLHGDYSFNSIPPVSFISIRFGATLLFLGLSAWLLFKNFFSRKPLALAVLLFFIAIMPTANILLYIGTTFAERLVFTASLALIPLLIALQRQSYRFTQPLLISLALMFSFLTVYRAAEWKTNFSLYKADVQRNPASYRTHYNYATALLETVPAQVKSEEEKQKLQLAIAEFNKAHEIMPDFADATLNLGYTYQKLGKNEKALEVYDQLIAADPAYARTYYNKGIVLYRLKRYQPARESFLQYTERGANSLSFAWYWAGVCSGYLGDFQAAIEQLNRSVQLDNTLWEAWNYLGMAYGNSRQWNKAVEAFTRAYQLKPSEQIKADLNMAQKAAAEIGL